MSNLKSIRIVFYSLLLLFFFTSFKTFQTDYAGKKDWIPEDFNPQNITLLIEKHPLNERWNNGMLKWLEKEYPWKYEVVRIEDLNDNSKYQDKKTYQFAMLWSDRTSRQVGSSFTYHDLEGHFLDRSIDKEYPKSGYAMNRGMSAYRKMFTLLVKKFKDGKDDD